MSTNLYVHALGPWESTVLYEKKRQSSYQLEHRDGLGSATVIVSQRQMNTRAMLPESMERRGRRFQTSEAAEHFERSAHCPYHLRLLRALWILRS